MIVKILYVDTPLLTPMPFTDRYMLSRDFELKFTIDGDQRLVIIPMSYITDGASIPQWCWSIVGTPYSPRFITAAIVHDYMCDHNWPVDLMSEIFRQLLRLSNVSKLKSDLMYKAVYTYKTIKKNP